MNKSDISNKTDEIKSITDYLNGEQYVTISIMTGNLVKKMMITRAVDSYCKTCTHQDTCGSKCANLEKFEELMNESL